MNTYIWKGEDGVELTGVKGLLKKGQQFLSELELNHPHAEPVNKGNSQPQQPAQKADAPKDQEQGKENN